MLFRSKYYKNGWMQNTKPYDGAILMLETLQEKGVKIGILSNKAESFVKLCTSQFFPTIDFCEVFGEVDEYEKKPDVKRLKELDLELAYFVGDTKVDMQTAINYGVKALGVTWGFRDEVELRANGADEIFNSVEELSGFLQSRI